MMIIALRTRAASICLYLNCRFSLAVFLWASPSNHRSRARIKTQRGLFAPFVTCACLLTAAFFLQLFQSPSRTASFSSASHLCMLLLSYYLYYANLDAHHSFPRDLLHSIRFSHKTCRSCCCFGPFKPLHIRLAHFRFGRACLLPNMRLLRCVCGHEQW